MELYKLKNKKLKEVEKLSFKNEREIQNLVEDNLEELFGLEFISSEFRISDFRLDTIGFNKEYNSFTIIEYKKGSSYSVIDQGYSYLSVMLDNKSDFLLEYNQKTKSHLKKEDIDWSQSRIIFISPSFNTYQKNSVNFQGIPFELWEIKKYSDGTISLSEQLPTSKQNIEKLGGKISTMKSVLSEVKVYEEDDIFKGKNTEVRELYNELKERLIDWEDVVFYPTRSGYISIKKNKKVKIYVNVFKDKLRLDFYSRSDFSGKVKSVKKRFILDDPKKLFKMFKSDYKEVYECVIRDNKDFDYIVLMLKQKFDS